MEKIHIRRWSRPILLQHAAGMADLHRDTCTLARGLSDRVDNHESDCNVEWILARQLHFSHQADPLDSRSIQVPLSPDYDANRDADYTWISAAFCIYHKMVQSVVD